MTKIVFSTENYYSKFAAKIWQYTKNHALAGDSEDLIFNSQN